MNQPTEISLLLVENDLIDVLAFKREVAKMNLSYNYVIASSIAEGYEWIKAKKFDIVILDYNLGDGTSEELLSILVNKGIPAIVVTGSGDEETAAMIVRKGAYDYLIKDPDRNYLKILPATIEKALEYKRNSQQTQLLLHAISHTSDCIFIVDLSGKILFVNKSSCGLDGIGVCSIGENLYERGHRLIAQETLNFIANSDAIKTKQVEIEVQKLNGKPVYFSLSYNLISNPFGDGKIAIPSERCAIAVARDITECKAVELELREANHKLEILSNIDGLTQIANRRCFDFHLQIEWLRLIREFRPLSLIMVDVDKFKQYNDYYGHLAGDDCLLRVAQAMQQVISRSSDLLARYGGEEFAIILPNTNLEGAIVVAKKIQEKISLLNIPHAYSEVKPIITVSLGIASIIPNSELQPDKLVARADRELYYAKQHGRDFISVHNVH